ncbi:MAG: DUF1329 domain-containing protein [Alphaproteobacteria bacterium]
MNRVRLSLQRAMRGAALLCAASLAGQSFEAEAQQCDGRDWEAGGVISNENLDCAVQGTFHGHKIGEMIPEKIAWQIREKDLNITLADPTPLAVDYRIREWTQKNRGRVEFNEATRTVSGWKAGVPFPDIDLNDPFAGIKVAWNYTYGVPRGDTQALYKFVFGLVDGDTGIERVQRWGYIRKYYKGVLGNQGPTLGDGEVFDKTLLVAFSPHDIKGLGTLTIRYDTGRLNDIWAYIRTVRRVRRLSGGAWFDVIGGTDVLQDNIETFNAYPTWYPKYKMLGRRTVLAMAHGTAPAWIEDADNYVNMFPRVDVSNPPYWNPIETWEPRDVYVVEAIPPKEHPYSKKVWYVDAEAWRPYFMEGYDKKGELWQFQHYSTGEYPVADDPEGSALLTWTGITVDFQRNHATFFAAHDSWVMSVPVENDEVSIGALESGGNLR